MNTPRRTLGDLIDPDYIPNLPGFPVADSPAMVYYTVVIAEGAMMFYFFNYLTGQYIPLERVSRLGFLCDRFVEYLDEYYGSAAEPQEEDE